jgi:hypothetical protein
MLIELILKVTPATFYVACLFFAPAQARAKEVVGVVTSVSGTWYGDGVKLVPGHRLTAGAVVKAKEPNIKYGRVVIMLLDHSDLSRICDRRGQCGEPLILPGEVGRESPERVESHSPPGFWERFVDALATSRPRRWKETFARGGDDRVREAVVKLKDGLMDLGPTLSGDDRHDYLVDIESASVGNGGNPGQVFEGLSMSRGGKNHVVLSVPGMMPGLYKITVSGMDATGRPTSRVEFLALVAAPQEYERAMREYAAARALAEKWDSNTPPRAKDFLRAFLEALAAARTR